VSPKVYREPLGISEAGLFYRLDALLINTAKALQV